jgi:mono/diheme cytochrome c family protein
MRDEPGPVEREEAPEREAPPSLWRALAAPVSVAIAAIALAVGLMVGVGLERGTQASPPTAPGEELPAGYEEGAALFASEGCGGCHLLTAAGAEGTVGPSLDGTGLSEAEIAAIVAQGRGAMPSFAGRLDEAEIDALAVYVATAARRSR